MKNIFSFLGEKLKTSEPTECIAILFCIAISLSLFFAFVLGIAAIMLGRTEKAVATQITILQTTIAVITFSGAIVAFVGWKELKSTASKTAENEVKNYFLKNAPEDKPADDSKKQKDDIENIKTENE